MSGRQYNMYNSQTAEAWKQRVMKENLHNAPSLRVFADLADDDDNQSVSSMGSRATGMTRASVATSRASVASTAALNRVRDLTPLPERTRSPPPRHIPPRYAPTFATPVTLSSAPDSPTRVTRQLPAARTLGTLDLAPWLPTTPCDA